jgi:hypothetical protein
MLQLRDLAGLSRTDREVLAREVEDVRTLADVAARWRIADVIVQDEFTHDVVVMLPDRRALSFDAT